MTEARFSIRFAGPLVTIQDAGRAGHMRFGVPASGPMDRLAFDAAHAALGNPPGTPAIEVSLGGLILECTEGAVSFSVTGGDFVLEQGGQKTAAWTIRTITRGERLAIRAGSSGSWAYLAFAGGPVSETWLGSQSTHSTSGFGGGALQTGQVLVIAEAALREDRLGAIARPDFPAKGPIRVVTGPQEHHFSEDAVASLLSAPFKVTDAYDRMGMRLSGPALALDGALSIPSEPILRGSIQVSGDGVPTVLLADHQTTGGYPKIATVLSCDTDRLSQSRAGDAVRFTSVTSPQAIHDVRAHDRQRAHYLAQIAQPRGSLQERLMRENLIDGGISD